MADYPENYSYQSSDKTLHWDGVSEAEEYQIEYSTDPQPQVVWQITYNGGTNLSCPFNKSPDAYAIQGKAKNDGRWSIYSPIEYIVIAP